jgi:hypothetical protein
MMLIAINIIFIFCLVNGYHIPQFYFIGTLISLILFYLFFEKPRYIAPLIVLMIPLEISKLFIPVLKVIEGPSGDVSVLDFSRIMVGLSIVVWFVKDLSNGRLLLYKDSIMRYLYVFVIYCMFSTLFISADINRGLIELFRYSIYLIMAFICIRFINHKNDVLLVYKFLFIISSILSLVGIAEYLFEFHLWNEHLGIRSSATFMDPNLYARFLSLTLISTIIFKIKKIRFNNILLNILIIIQIVALFVSVSRGGLLAFLLGLLFVVFFIDRNIRLKLFPFILGTLVLVPFVFLILIKARGEDLSFFDMGQRIGLIYTGVKIFLHNLILGIGLGSFETIALGSYAKFLPYGGRGVTLSHTSVVTVMAELGSIGLGIVCMIFYKIYATFRQLLNSKDAWISTFSLLAATQILIVFISSQSAGRMFEDPFLWFFIGVLISINKINKAAISCG